MGMPRVWIRSLETPRRSHSAAVSDLTGREKAILWTLAAPILLLGLYPAPLLRLMNPAIEALALR